MRKNCKWKNMIIQGNNKWMERKSKWMVFKYVKFSPRRVNLDSDNATLTKFRAKPCFVRAISQQRQHKALQYDWKTTTSTNKSCLWLEASVFMYYFPCPKCTYMIQVQSLRFALALSTPRHYFCLVNKKNVLPRLCVCYFKITKHPFKIIGTRYSIMAIQLKWPLLGIIVCVMLWVYIILYLD